MRVVWISGILLAVAAPAVAQGPVSASPDTTLALDGVTFSDDDVAVDNLSGVTIPVSLGTLPANAAVIAYHLLGNGDQLFALDIAAELPGPLTVRAGDVVRYDGANHALEFDAAAAGIPPGVRVDAVSEVGSDLLLSFDTTVDLAGLVAADEDVVQWNGVGFAMALDASTLGIDPALDLDAIDAAGGGYLWASFDGHGSLGGKTFADEDVVLLDAGGATLSVIYDGSSEDAAWEAADLEATYLPEPAAPTLWAGIAVWLAWCARRRNRARNVSGPASPSRTPRRARGALLRAGAAEGGRASS